MTHSYRPELHVTATTGVINAPAGALFDGVDWHVFTQYRDDVDSPARWAHHVRRPDHSRTWRQLADVVVASNGETDVWAGSAIKDGNGAILYFTSVKDGHYTINTARIADLAATTSESYNGVSPQVRRTGVTIDTIDAVGNFRSPCVVPDWRNSNNQTDHEWLMLAVVGDEDTPEIMVVRSPDRVHWSLEGPLTFEGDSGIDDSCRIVSPRLVYLKDEVDGRTKDVLLLTVECNDQDDQSGYMVGHFDGPVFTVDTPFTPIDYGHDFTRPRAAAMNASGWIPDAEQVLVFGLMSPVSRGFDPHTDPSFTTEGWDRCLSLAKLTTLQNGRLYFTPSPLLVESVIRAEQAHAITAVLDVNPGGFVEIAVVDTDDEVVATVTHCGDQLVLDRSWSSHIEDEAPAVAPLIETDTQAVTVIVDSSCIDVYADGGVVSMASRMWPKRPVAGFRVSTGHGASVTRTILFGDSTESVGPSL